MRYERMLLLPLAVFAACSAGFAQKDAQKALDAVRSSEPYRRAIAITDTKYEGGLSTRCMQVQLQMQRSEVKVLIPPVVSEAGTIVSGQWKEMTEGSACGESRIYNALVVYTNGSPRVLPLFPGHSHAGPLLQRDGVAYAAIGAGAEKSCTVDVLETSLPDGEPGGARLPWNERWTVSACNKRSMVLMHFIPDATGTTIQVSPKETVAVSR